MKNKSDAGTENNEKHQLGLEEIKEILADHLKGNTLRVCDKSKWLPSQNMR